MDHDPTFNRRSFIAGTSAALAATTALGCGTRNPATAQVPTTTGDLAVAAADGHQPGIATAAQQHLQLAAFDFERETGLELRELLQRWSALAAQRAVSDRTPDHDLQADEALDLAHTNLTITLGLGPTLFDHDRLGLDHARPAALKPLPAFRGDALEPAHGGGDLCIQACANDPQSALHAIHALTRAAGGYATPRWVQTGFLPGTPGTPRNLMGFKDGTNSIKPDDHAALDQHVWLPADHDPAWMRNGTYAVVRRIRMLLDVWDTTSTPTQEAAIGRHKLTGAPLGARTEHHPVDLEAHYADGSPLIPADAHIRLAAPATNHGTRILRRGYNYADDIDHATGQRDQGLIFISYQRDPGQFIALQRRLAAHDALNKHILHTASGLFACPPAPTAGGFIGEQLFA